MATATPTRPVIRPDVGPLAYWHLLSLDAPTVAALWTWFVAASCGIVLPVSSTVAMAVAVWILYAADRILDARGSLELLEMRHHFHHRFRRIFLTCIVVATALLAMLIVHLDPAALRLYGVLGFLLAGYFAFIHTTIHTHRSRAPKEIAVGIFFAAAVFIPTVARRPALRLALLPDAILFAAICSLNCLMIYDWEHPTSDRAHASTRLALRYLPQLAITTLSASLTLTIFTSHHAIPTACAVSSLLLLILHRGRNRLPLITLRAAADLALTTPLLLLPFLF